MLSIDTVLCPLDFSAISKREIDIASAVCRAFSAELVLHHNIAAAAPGFGKSWEWEETHWTEREQDQQASRNLQEALAYVPEGIKREGCLTCGPIGTMLLGLAEGRAVDLIVLGTHGWSTPDHASVGERIIRSSGCPILTIQEGKGKEGGFTLEASTGQPVRVAVPTDFSAMGEAVLSYAFELARLLPVRLYLFHVLPGTPVAFHTARQEMEKMIPADLAGRVECHVGWGSATDEILHFVDRIDPAFVVMGEHATGFFRRLFTHDTARDILHRSAAPVWFVPPHYETPMASA
jgi:universal stress protein A